MTSLIDSILTLPPVEKRRKRAPFFEKLQDERHGSRIHENDAYITYIVVRNAFILSASIGFGLILTALFNPEGLYAIKERIPGWHAVLLDHAIADKSIVVTFAYDFAFIMGVFIYLTLPYYLALFFRNVDLGKVDLFRFYRIYYPHHDGPHWRKRLRRALRFLAAQVLAFVCTFLTYAAAPFMARWLSPLIDLYNSHTFLLLIYVFQVAGLAVGAMLSYSVIFLIYMALGYDKRTDLQRLEQKKTTLTERKDQ